MSNTALPSQMGLHFDPEGSEHGGYRITANFYWKPLKEKFFSGTPTQKLVIEAGFHFCGEAEHNAGTSYTERVELLVLVETIRFFIEEVVENV